MLETYKAKLRGNRVVWNGETPDAAKNRAEVDVYITIVERGSSHIQFQNSLLSQEYKNYGIRFRIHPETCAIGSGRGVALGSS